MNKSRKPEREVTTKLGIALWRAFSMTSLALINFVGGGGELVS